MNFKCFDEGTLQAFLDNELPPELSQTVARHIAVCETCAVRLAEVEEETAFVFAALEQEFNTLIPTQRLWTKINESIQVEAQKDSFRPRLTAFFSGFSLTNPSMAAFASLFFVIVTFAVLLSLKSGDQNLNQASVNRPASEQNLAVATAPKVNPPSQSTPTEVREEEVDQPITPIQKADYTKPAPSRKQVYNLRLETSRDEVRPVRLDYLPGEESYLSTIASLEKTINSSKDTVLSPSSRFAFEKDLAVVNDAIRKMKVEVRKNPNNEGAKMFLFSSYQNKIDLLNSVAERSELIATLQ